MAGKRRVPLPDVLEIWGIPWTKRGDVWDGPAITDPEDPTLALAVEQTASEHCLPLWGMKPTVLNQRNLLDLHTLTLTH
jgi:hypothetical protein